MPVYQCFSPQGLLDESTRANLAAEITRIHCDATGIPPSFVNVMFLDIPAGRYFVAGKPAAHSVIYGAIRLGRDVATRQRILRELSQAWTRLTGQPEEELLVSLWENPAENAMEGGAIFPQIGQELQLPARVTIWGRLGRHLGAGVATGATLGWEATTMRYALLMHYREPAEGEISEEALAEAREAFGAYGRALESAGVLLLADVLQPSAATTSVTCREGGLQVQDGPFAETKEALAGIFVVDVPDLDAAIGWAEKCPGAQWGFLEVRPTATAFVDGAWTR